MDKFTAVKNLENQREEQKITNDLNEIYSQTDLVDTSIATLEVLINYSNVLESSIEKGRGLTEDAAELAEVAIEAICTRLGYKPIKKIIPAMESFGGTSSRLDATKYALEGISEIIVKTINAIIEFFKNIAKNLKVFLNIIFNRNKRAKKEAEEIKKEVEEINTKILNELNNKTKKPREINFSIEINKDICKDFQVDADINDLRIFFDIATDMLNNHSSLNDLQLEMSTMIDQYLEKLDRVTDSIKKGDASLELMQELHKEISESDIYQDIHNKLINTNNLSLVKGYKYNAKENKFFISNDNRPFNDIVFNINNENIEDISSYSLSLADKNIMYGFELDKIRKAEVSKKIDNAVDSMHNFIRNHVDNNARTVKDYDQADQMRNILILIKETLNLYMRNFISIYHINVTITDSIGRLINDVRGDLKHHSGKW